MKHRPDLRQTRDHTIGLEIIAERIADVLFVVACDGRITLWNPEAQRRLRHFADTAAPLNVADLVARARVRHPDGRPMLPEETAMARALRGERVAVHEGVYYDPGVGRDVPYRVSAIPLLSHCGEVHGAVVSVRDSTEQKDWERQREEFLSMVVHDLRNPLTAALGYAYLLQRGLSRAARPDPRQIDAIETIVEQLTRMNAMLGELREAARAERALLGLRPQPCDLVPLVRRVAAAHGTATDRHHVSVEVAPGAERLVGAWDPCRIEQVVEELLRNAITYSPAGGSIQVRLERAGREAVVVVSDQGVGIPPERVPRLFDRYHRVPGAGAHSGEGLGLGLAIGYQIVTRHGGRMWVESTPGQGSAFSFTLPLDEGTARSVA
ncbi:MAG: PAS domain-containing protein [Chloroflexi bacterium]|nr:PAS domain-containing protein [Chloroflexota bacterium]